MVEIYLAAVGHPPAAVRHHIERGRIYTGTDFLTAGDLIIIDPMTPEWSGDPNLMYKIAPSRKAEDRLRRFPPCNDIRI